MLQQIHYGHRAVIAALAALAFAAIILAGCEAVVQPYAVRRGTARDYLFSVEPLNNSTVRVWLKSDNLAAYCVLDPALAAKFTDALQNWNGEVLVTYHSLSPIEQKAREWTLSGCGTFSGTNASSFEIYGVDSLKLVPGRGGPDTGR